MDPASNTPLTASTEDLLRQFVDAAKVARRVSTVYRRTGTNSSRSRQKTHSIDGGAARGSSTGWC